MIYKKNINKAYSLVEVIIAVTLFTIMFGYEIYCLYSIINLEIKTKANIYNALEEVNIISKKYNIKYEENN